MYKKKKYRYINLTVSNEINYQKIFSTLKGSETERTNMEHSILLFLSFLNPTDYYIDKYQSTDFFKFINYVEFGKLTGNRLKQVKDILSDDKYPIIDVNESYQSGNYSKSYRLKEKFFNGSTKTVTIESKISQNFYDFKEKKEKDLENRLSEYYHITEFCKKEVFTFDPVVIDYVNTVEKLLIDKIDNHITLNYSKLLKVVLDRKIKSMRKSINKVFTGEFSVSMSANNMRFNSVFTNMKRELRSFLLINGNPSVEIDISSSHPYILGSIINNDFLNSTNEYSFSNLYNEFYDILIKDYNTNKLFTTDYNIINNKDNPTGSFMSREFSLQSVDRYKKLPFSDGVYGYLNNEIFNRVYDEKIIKKGIMNFINMKRFRSKNYIVKTLISEFPGINGFIETIQKVGRSKYNVSLLLQRVESYLLLKVACRKLFENCICFCTVHDSVIVESNLAKKTYEVVKTSIEGTTAIPVGLKIKNSNPFDFIDITVEEIWTDLIELVTKLKKQK